MLWLFDEEVGVRGKFCFSEDEAGWLDMKNRFRPLPFSSWKSHVSQPVSLVPQRPVSDFLLRPSTLKGALYARAWITLTRYEGRDV
jgi:hypothetical protein